MPLTVLRDGHRELLRLMDDIIESAGHAGPASQVAQARHIMAQAMARFLAQHDRMVIAPLRRSPRPEHRALVRRLTDETLAMRQATIAHYGTWTLDAIEADPREYRMAVRAVYRMLDRRFQYEEDEVHPRVIEAIQALAAQRAA
ncbi:hypothetical protein [Sphingomonas sp. dw_22]|uniref:hypothetical protein n=1 Tax=Sphingomonas sp. dw_22 TaxID=2721175 RepID=UPI001BD32EF5|nr:hypothetical protein [Sphingomonas sp. dw_22]